MIHGVNGGEQPDFSKKADEIAAEIDMLDGKANDTVNFAKISGDKLTIWEKYAEEYGLEHAPGQKKISIKDIRAKIFEVLQLNELQRQEKELEAEKARKEAELELARIPQNYKGYVICLSPMQTDFWMVSDKKGNSLGGRKTREEAKALVDKIVEEDMRNAELEDISAHRAEAEKLALKKLGVCNENSVMREVTVQTKDGKFFTFHAVPVKTEVRSDHYKGKEMRQESYSHTSTKSTYAWDLGNMKEFRFDVAMTADSSEELKPQ